MSKEKIKQLAVKIFDKIGKHIGSGTLFVPKERGKYAYVFTAAHVAILGIEKEKLKFKMVIDEKEKNFETNDEDSMKIHEKYPKGDDVKEYDVAVIKVNRENWMEGLPTLTIGDPKEEDEIQGQGFPINACEPKFVFHMTPLEGKIGTCSNVDKRFQLVVSNDLNSSDRDSELKGYSGSGLYEKRDGIEDLVLVGIFSYGQGKNALQKRTNSFYSELLQEICRKYNFEKPEKANQIPSSFKYYVEEATNLIENNELRQQILDLLAYLIEEGLIPAKLVASAEKDIYDIPECNNKYRIRCKECWIARLKLIYSLALLDDRIDNFKNPKIALDDKKEIPIEFFCSEGSEGNSQLKKVVRSIYNKGFAYNTKFRDNAILVWASKGNPTHKSMNRTEFSRIVGKISTEPIYRKKFDTMYGESKKNDLSIIHIDKLIEAIDVEDVKDVNNKLLEAFKNVIS